MQGNSTKNLLYQISDKLGRPRQEMEKFIQIFESNWYDTKQSLKSLKIQDYEKFQIPSRLANLIMDQVGGMTGTSTKEEKMDIQSPLENQLYLLRKKCKEDQFGAYVETMYKIYNNIRQNLMEEKFKILKKSNNKIGHLLTFPENVAIFKYGGFEETQNNFTMFKINISLLDECIEVLNNFTPKAKFNPYEQSITSRGNTKSQFYEEGSVAFNKKLEDLEKERQLMMSKPIKNREIKIFKVQPTVNFSKVDMQFNEQKFNEEEKIYSQRMKEIMKSFGQDPKFMNRRKQEYYALVKIPCFTETIIRVKLPDNVIFECKFSPLQTLQSLVDIFHSYVANKNLDYYLYMTPPVQKLSGMLLRKTFYELGCAPRAIFLLKCNDQKLHGQKILDVKKFHSLS